MILWRRVGKKGLRDKGDYGGFGACITRVFEEKVVYVYINFVCIGWI